MSSDNKIGNTFLDNIKIVSKFPAFEQFKKGIFEKTLNNIIKVILLLIIQNTLF